MTLYCKLEPMLERRKLVGQVLRGISESGGIGLANLSPEAILPIKEPVSIGTSVKRREIASGRTHTIDTVALLSELGERAPELQHIIMDTMSLKELSDFVDALEVRENPRMPDLRLLNKNE